MILSKKEADEALFIEKKNDCISPKILKLRKKIRDQNYIDDAVQRIAQVISKKLVESPEELHIMI